MSGQQTARRRPWMLLGIVLVLGAAALVWRLSRGGDPRDASARKAADRLREAYEREPVKPGTKLPDDAIDPGPGQRGAIGPP